jgi:hypothetical protein
MDLQTSKLCKKCNITKPVSDFYQSRSKQDGLHYCCIPCDIERKRKYNQRPEVKRRNRKRYQTRREVVILPRVQILSTLKTGVSCTDCLQNYPTVCMDFDHVRGDKQFLIAHWPHLTKWTERDLHSELDKCELVCANCHRIRTAEREQFGRPINEIPDEIQ